MNRVDWFQPKWRSLRNSALLAMAGVAVLVTAFITNIRFLAVGGLLIIPLLFWLVMIPLLHWKDRYRGESNTLWGALILIETSGWMKIVYWFRHILPDWKRTGRYRDAP